MGRRHESSEDHTHIDLLALTGRIRGAMIDDDIERMHSLLCRLRSDLLEHLVGERQATKEVRGSARSVIVDGQQRLVHLLDEVMLDIDGDSASCNCLVRAAEIDFAVRRQAKLENVLLDHQPLAHSDEIPLPQGVWENGLDYR